MLHVVEQRYTPPRVADNSRIGYLSSLDETDRRNLEAVVEMLKSRLPSDTAVLAVGGTAADFRATRYHKDIDIKVLCNAENIPMLSNLVQQLLSELDGFKVEGEIAGEVTSRLGYVIRRFIPEWFQLTYFTLTPQTSRGGKSIDVFICPIPTEEYFKRTASPYVRLH